MIDLHVFLVKYSLTIHHWIEPLGDNGIVGLNLDNDHLWELRCSSKPEMVETEVTMRGERPANHVVEAEVRRLHEPGWLNQLSSKKGGYNYSVEFIEVRYKTVGELIRDDDSASWYDLTEQHREPIENILPRRAKTLGDITAQYRRKLSDILPNRENQDG